MTASPEDPDLSTTNDPAELVPDGDRAAQAETAWPDDVDEDIVPDADRIVPGLDDDA